MEELRNIQPLISLFISFATLVGIVIAIYKFSSDPDAKASERITRMEDSCVYKHEAVDKALLAFQENFLFLKENHIKHIEANIKSIDRKQVQILAILSERYNIIIKEDK